MIIFGASKGTLGTYEITFTKCKNCNSSKTLLYRVYQKYGHVFWIPTFPIEKTVVTVCTHCKQSLTDEQIYPEYWQAILDQNIKHKAPLWTFTGLIILGIIITIIISFAIAFNIRRKELLINPKKDDIYYISENGNYTLYKINKVTKDSIYINECTMSSTGRPFLDQIIHQKDIYDTKIKSFAKSEILQLHYRGRIFDIVRED